MSTPQGPDRQDRDGSEGEQTGDLPAWGTPPPGGWGQADPQTPPAGAPARGPDTGQARGWDTAPEQTGGWAPTGGAGGTGAWAPTGGAGETGAWAPTGGGGETGAWAPTGGGGETGAWAPTGGAGETGAWAPTGGAGETGAWDSTGQAQPGAYGGHRHADDGPGDAWNPGPAADEGFGPGATEQPPPLWGDEATTATPAAGGRRRRRAEEPADPWDDGHGAAARPGVWGPGPEERFEPGDEPWAPNEAVRPPRRGPLGLGRAALAAIAAAVVVVVVLVLAFVAPGFAIQRTLDQTALQNGVTKILTQNYGLQVGAVQCQDDVKVSAGTTFECHAVVDGEQVTVPGRVTSDNGDYQVSRV